MNPQKRQEIFRRFRAANPKPRTELIYRSPFELLVSVILSAQATDKSVNKATAELFKKGEYSERYSGLGRPGAIDIHQVHRALQWQGEKHHSDVPAAARTPRRRGAGGTREALEDLPGVGRKTANVILNTAFGQPTIAVDTHIFRVANRTGIAPGKTVREVEDKLLKFVPEEFRLDAHHWLILHGRYVCKARRPECPTCIIADLCEYKHKTSA